MSDEQKKLIEETVRETLAQHGPSNTIPREEHEAHHGLIRDWVMPLGKDIKSLFRKAIFFGVIFMLTGGVAIFLLAIKYLEMGRR